MKTLMIMKRFLIKQIRSFSKGWKIHFEPPAILRDISTAFLYINIYSYVKCNLSYLYVYI